MAHEHDFPFNFIDDGSCIYCRLADRVQLWIVLSIGSRRSGPCRDSFGHRHRSSAASCCYVSDVVIRRRCSRSSRHRGSDRYNSASAKQSVWRMGQCVLRPAANGHRYSGSIDEKWRMLRSNSCPGQGRTGSESGHCSWRSDSVEFRRNQGAGVVVTEPTAFWLATGKVTQQQRVDPGNDIIDADGQCELRPRI